MRGGGSREEGRLEDVARKQIALGLKDTGVFTSHCVGTVQDHPRGRRNEHYLIRQTAHASF